MIERSIDILVSYAKFEADNFIQGGLAVGTIFLAIGCVGLWMSFRPSNRKMEVETKPLSLPPYKTLREFYENTDDQGDPRGGDR